MKVHYNEIYTLEEAQKILRVSRSTMLRLIKKNVIKAAKIGRQYRILGKEILHAVSPQLEMKVWEIYDKGRRWAYSDEKDKDKQKSTEREKEIKK